MLAELPAAAQRQVWQLKLDLYLAANDWSKAFGSLMSAGGNSDIVVINELGTLLGLNAARAFDVLVPPLLTRLYAARTPLVLVIDEAHLSRFEATAKAIHDRCARVHFPQLTAAELATEVEALAAGITQATGQQFDPAAIRLALAPAAKGERLAHPGLASNRLQIAAGRAQLAGRETVEAQDVHLAGGLEQVQLTRDELATSLRRSIRGQDAAV